MTFFFHGVMLLLKYGRIDMNKKGYGLPHVIIIIIATAIISGVTSGIIITSSFNANGKSYSNLVLDENVQEFLDVYAKLTDDYYEDVNKKELIESAINAMTNYLDETYTTYIESDNATSLMQELNGKSLSIGITTYNHEIINIVPNSPAYQNGLMLKDKIIAINDVDVTGYSDNKIESLIKQNNSNVLLKINRNDEILEFSMQAEEIEVSPVVYYMLDNTSIGYLKMTIFSNKLTIDTTKALNELQKAGMTKLIIDLRDNTGGYLDEAREVASLFLEKGKVIYYLEDKEKLKEEKDETNAKLSIPVAVLVNNNTASAAEILTGALRYSYGAMIIGNKTYGKGKVQHTLTLNDQDMVKYTSSRWLMPNKECIDKEGIIPDYIVENETITSEENPLETVIYQDNVLNKAIELLT